MRLSNKFGATLATAALGAATVLGGAGIAQAQSSGSLGSLGSSDAAPVVLTVAGDEDEVGGTVANNTEAPITCAITATTAEAAAAIEEALVDDATLEGVINATTAFATAAAANQNATANVTVPAGETEVWAGGDSYNPTEDFVSGAFAQCGEELVFAYESTGLLGSLDMGSLGS